MTSNIETQISHTYIIRTCVDSFCSYMFSHHVYIYHICVLIFSFMHVFTSYVNTSYLICGWAPVVILHRWPHIYVYTYNTTHIVWDDSHLQLKCSIDNDFCYYHSWRNNVVIAFGVLSSCYMCTNACKGPGGSPLEVTSDTPKKNHVYIWYTYLSCVHACIYFISTYKYIIFPSTTQGPDGDPRWHQIYNIYIYVYITYTYIYVYILYM